MTEGSAILAYLCDKHNWNSFYPLDIRVSKMGLSLFQINSYIPFCELTHMLFLLLFQERASINSYLSHHHNSTRKMSLDIFRPFINSQFGGRHEVDAFDAEAARESALKIARRFENVFLGIPGGPFINGFDRPTIADLMAYNEISQIEQLHIASFSDMPVLAAWLGRMRALPEHDTVHKSIFKMGEMRLKKIASDKNKQAP